MRAGFAVPVLVGNRVESVLEFFATTAVEPDEALLQILGNIGAQVGRAGSTAQAGPQILSRLLQPNPHTPCLGQGRARAAITGEHQRRPIRHDSRGRRAPSPLRTLGRITDDPGRPEVRFPLGFSATCRHRLRAGRGSTACLGALGQISSPFHDGKLTIQPRFAPWESWLLLESEFSEMTGS